jgi:hypothetical protein
MTEDGIYIFGQEPPKRKVVKGFAGHCSWGDGREEFVEVPEECPAIATGGCGLVGVSGED